MWKSAVFCLHALYMHEITHTSGQTYIHRHTRLKCRAVETCLVNLFVKVALGGRRKLTHWALRGKNTPAQLFLSLTLSPCFSTPSSFSALFCSLPNFLSFDTFLPLFSCFIVFIVFFALFFSSPRFSLKKQNKTNISQHPHRKSPMKKSICWTYTIPYSFFFLIIIIIIFYSNRLH